MISPDVLLRKLGQADWPRVFDVRGDDEVARTPRLLPAARRVTQADLLDAALDGDRTAPIVVYCQKGGPRAEAAAAFLRARGIGVESLRGGVTAWLEAGAPTASAEAVAALPAAGSRWITRARPKIDRVACPWFVRRFVDPRAEFYYVDAATVHDAAKLLRAEPFDVDDAAFSHRGAECSFDSFVRHFDVEDEALARVATIVRGADTARPDLAPEAAGLLAMSLGLSASEASDEAMLERATTFYDSLYAFARHAAAERHDWTGKR